MPNAVTVVLLLSFIHTAAAGAIERTQVAEVLGPYVGQWRGQKVHQNRQGQRFHYRYDVEWLDQARTIARTNIRRHFHDGAVELAWEGFKGYDPTDASLYYYGFSPSGRLARGKVHRSGDGTLITEYTGYSSEGEPVALRDESTPVANQRFESVTYIRRSPDGEWRAINRATWERIGAQGSTADPSAERAPDE